MKDSMILYTAYAEKFRRLNNEQFGELVRLMIQYQLDGIAPEVDDIMVSMAFDSVKYDIDRNNEKYKEICEKRRENGAKGGLAKASNSKQKLAKATKSNQKLASVADNDNENDNDNDNDFTFRKSKQKELLKTYTDDESLNKAIKDFIEHRKKLRKPMTDKAVELFINRVKKMSSTTAGQIALINTAIERGWQTVYPANDKDTQPEERDNREKLRELERRAFGE